MTREEQKHFDEFMNKHHTLIGRKNQILTIISNNIEDTSLHGLSYNTTDGNPPKNMFVNNKDYELFLNYKQSLINRLKEINAELEALILDEKTTDFERQIIGK
jgi:hypothetical protein